MSLYPFDLYKNFKIWYSRKNLAGFLLLFLSVWKHLIFSQLRTNFCPVVNIIPKWWFHAACNWMLLIFLNTAQRIFVGFSGWTIFDNLIGGKMIKPILISIIPPIIIATPWFLGSKVLNIPSEPLALVLSGLILIGLANISRKKLKKN